MNEEKLEQLKEYAMLEGCELGEAVYELIGFYRFVKTNAMLSGRFEKAIELELESQLRYFQYNTKIVETKYELPAKKVYKLIEEIPQWETRKELVILTDE